MTATDQPEHLLGSVERLTFHSEQMGFAVLRVKVRAARIGHSGGVSRSHQPDLRSGTAFP